MRLLSSERLFARSTLRVRLNLIHSFLSHMVLSIRGSIIPRDMPIWISSSRTRSADGRLTRFRSCLNENRLHLRLQLHLRLPGLHLQRHLHPRLQLHLKRPLPLRREVNTQLAMLPAGKRLQQQAVERIETDLRPRLHCFASREQFVLRKERQAGDHRFAFSNVRLG